MSRVLYWNINKFSIRKINNPGTHATTVASGARLALIGSVLTQSGADIIAVGEVCTAAVGPGRLIAGAGLLACRYLLVQLRAAQPDSDWRLVPPLVVGTAANKEGVAVYYKGTIIAAGGGVIGSRIFTGPRKWSGGVPGASLLRNNPAHPGDYEADQQADLGPNRPVPAGALYNVGEAENQLAAGIDYWPIAAAAGAAPLAFAPYREPYCCSFCETNAAGAVQRNITIFVVHAKPADPMTTLENLSMSEECSSALEGGETRVVMGDFNLNLLEADGSNALPYVNFEEDDYTVLLTMPQDPPAGAAADIEAYKSYAMTHLKAAALHDNLFFSAGGVAKQYPGFGYKSTQWRGKLTYSIDNILVRQAAAPADGYQATVANVCVGTPYADPFAFGAAVPLGPIEFARHIFPALPAMGPCSDFPWVAGVAPQFEPGSNNVLMARYRLIYSTSDHLAVVANV